jgi:hypothetical protein
MMLLTLRKFSCASFIWPCISSPFVVELRHVAWRFTRSSWTLRNITTSGCGQRCVDDNDHMHEEGWSVTCLKLSDGALPYHGLGGRVEFEHMVNRNGSSVAEALPASDILVLPPYSETIELVKQYFASTGRSLPFIDEDSFLETLRNSFRDKFRHSQRTWLSLLNSVMACACIASAVTQPSRVDSHRAETFFNRATELSKSCTLGENNLEYSMRSLCLT